MSKRAEARLLPPEALAQTGPVDHADWNFRPAVGRIVRLRYDLAIRLLPRHTRRLLEVGYGSGVFLPELSRRCDELMGIDVHDMRDRVAAEMETSAVRVRLVKGDVTRMPFRDGSFDCVVAISTLEFVEDPHAAAREIARVLAPDGCLVVVTPGHSKIADLGLWLLTGQNARRDFGFRREALVPALLRHFDVGARAVFPPFGGRLLRLYTGLRLVVRAPGP